MKALVAVKRVPDGNVPVRLKPDGSGVDLAGMPMCMNPFDEAALEQAIQWKEAGIVREIVTVSIGSESCQETLRHALALGADRAILISDDTQPEPLAIARLLKALILRESPDLVLLGKQSSDTGCAQVGPMLAGLLGWPQGDFVSAMTLENGQSTITREIEGGQESLALPLPAIITADLRLATPRYLKLPQVLQAKRKPIETLQSTALSPHAPHAIELLQVSSPPPRRPARHTRNTEELLGWLREEGLLGETARTDARSADRLATTGQVLILAEHDGKRLHPAMGHTVSAARQLGTEISMLVTGFDAGHIAAQAASIAGVTQVLLADAGHLAHQPAEDLARLLAQCVRERGFFALIAAATPFGKAILPRAAGLLECAMCSDIVAIHSPDTLTGPIHAGEVLATWRNTADIQILSVRASAFARAGEQVSAPIQPIALPPTTSRSRWLGINQAQSERPALTDARIIVSGGSALQSTEKFHATLEPLADRLGAAIGATLSAVNAGFIGNNQQVGQTGVTVAPDFYFAIGLSGAAQHMAGMRDSRIIIAINKDPEAPVCRHADYVLEGDLFEKVPELLRLLE